MADGRPSRKLTQDRHEDDKPGQDADRNNDLTANSPIHMDLRTMIPPASSADRLCHLPVG